MEMLGVFAMTAIAVLVLLLAIVTSQHSNLYSARNLFLAVWVYYGFSIGFDLFLGLEIPYTQGEIDLLDPTNLGAIAFVMWNYILLGATFLITYTFVGRDQTSAVDSPIQVRMPSLSVLYFVHGIAILAFMQIFFSMSRMDRLALANTSNAYKLACLIIPIVLALDVCVIISDRQKAWVAFVLAILLSLATGNRSYVLFVLLVAVYHWRPSIQGWRLLAIISSTASMVFFFKTAYSVGQGWVLGQQVTIGMIFENMQTSLSGMDAAASYLIAIFYTQQESPWWLGSSYLQTPLLMTWPRFLGGLEVSTLAEEYIWTYHPDIAARGGAMAFSAIAEAWLNFGHVGPILIGAFWGLVVKALDSRPRGIIFYLGLMVIVRIFRSDFATLYKHWGLVWGTLFVFILAALSLHAAISLPGAHRPLNPSPRDGRIEATN